MHARTQRTHIINISGHALSEEARRKYASEGLIVVEVPVPTAEYTPEGIREAAMKLAERVSRIRDPNAIIIPPGYAPLAVSFTAALHGLRGHFPKIAFLVREGDTFVHGGYIPLEELRGKFFGKKTPPEKKGRVLINISGRVLSERAAEEFSGEYKKIATVEYGVLGTTESEIVSAAEKIGKKMEKYAGYGCYGKLGVIYPGYAPFACCILAVLYGLYGYMVDAEFLKRENDEFVPAGVIRVDRIRTEARDLRKEEYEVTLNDLFRAATWLKYAVRRASDRYPLGRVDSIVRNLIGALREIERNGGGAGRGGTAAAEDDGIEVICPYCGTSNRPGMPKCNGCGGEL